MQIQGSLTETIVNLISSQEKDCMAVGTMLVVKKKADSAGVLLVQVKHTLTKEYKTTRPYISLVNLKQKAKSPDRKMTFKAIKDKKGNYTRQECSVVLHYWNVFMCVCFVK